MFLRPRTFLNCFALELKANVSQENWVQIQLMRLLVGLLVWLLVGKTYHTRQKDGYSLATTGIFQKTLFET